jgi:hypothetical protein
MVIEGLHVRGTLGQAREGQAELDSNLVGILGHRLHDVIIRDNRFEGIVNGIILGGTDLLVEGNHMRHSWGDLLRISPQVLGDGACAETRGVIVRNNILSQIWANNRLHPDFVHLFASGNVSCDVADVLIEGNIAFAGRDGLLQPDHPTGLEGGAPVPVPGLLPDENRVLHRLVGPGVTVLPEPVCQEGVRGMIGVQRDVSSTGPIELRAASAPFQLGRTLISSVTLTEPGETWRFLCRTDAESGQDYWQTMPGVPSLQGVFSNALPAAAAYSDITVRHNILWVTAPAGVSFRDDADRGIEVVNNSFLRPWPGDLNGDGTANGSKDGFNPMFNSGRVIMGDKTGYSIRRNVTGFPDRFGDDSNDAGLRHDDAGRSVVARFAMGPGGTFSPETAREAVALARPRADGLLAGRGLGALGVTPDTDPYDWSWVRDW